jgi:hypothetical protein
MPAQPTLRPFDLAVAMRLLTHPGERYEPMADALLTSTSAVHRAVARLTLAGFCQSGARVVDRAALVEFLVSGVRYAFPAMLGPDRVGVPTAYGHPSLQSLRQRFPDLRTHVWSSDKGAERGPSIAPLFSNLPSVAVKTPALHGLLSLVDAVRLVSDERRAAVNDLVRSIVLRYEPAVAMTDSGARPSAA